MNPGTPVSTTALNLIRVLIPSLISRMASSGRVETSKFSLMPAGGLCGGQERRSALDRPGERDLGRSFADPIGDSGDDRIRQQVGLAAMTQRGESLQDDSILLGNSLKGPIPGDTDGIRREQPPA